MREYDEVGISRSECCEESYQVFIDRKFYRTLIVKNNTTVILEVCLSKRTIKYS